MTRRATDGTASQQILSNIVEVVFGVILSTRMPLAKQLSDISWAQRLSEAIYQELGIWLSPEALETSESVLELSTLLNKRAPKNQSGQSVLEIYEKIERLAREEIHPKIPFHWYARWTDFQNVGHWFTKPDGLDYVELIMRIELEFGFGIPNQVAQDMQTVGQTVRYIWQRSCAQHFTLRLRPDGVCNSTFTFHEVRRLLIMRGGVKRSEVRMDTRLTDLLPSWYSHFLKQVPNIFHLELPKRQSSLFPRGLGKQITVKELVTLIASKIT